ncbi:MAG: AAA family ATPase, partial [Actinophytocola sp.]|nr:AAA family ATPase [Actinophytocola sp.]
MTVPPESQPSHGPRVVPAAEEGLDAPERKVVQALREQLPDDATVLVNLRLTDTRADREADAVVVWPGVGVAVIEVKGGHVEYADGTWWVGRPHQGRAVQPVKQALKCKYGIREVLRGHPRWTGPDPRMVHHVAVPYTRLPSGFTAPECPRTLISDRDDIPHLADRLAAQLDALESAARPPTEAQAASLVAALTGPQHPQAAFATRNAAHIAEREEHCELLTAQQGSVLDMLREVPRVQILGGAGTGKTWLAVEQARRLAEEGQRVALLCYSKGLAMWLQRRVQALPEDQRPAYVGTFHALGIQWGAKPVVGAPQEYWESGLPAEMVRHARYLTPEQRFDAIIIDEVQDFAPPWWEPVLAALKHPDTGRVVTFADEGQLIFPRGALPAKGFTKIVLDENLRNTEPI